MAEWRFDRTVNFGHIITIIVLLLGMWQGFASVRERLLVIETKLQPIWDDYTGRIRVVDRKP
jgi:hypothetical protein